MSVTKTTSIGPSKTSDQRPLVQRPGWPADQSNRQGPGAAEEPFSVPPPCAVPRWRGDTDWDTWFRNLGRQMRALREFLGISQDRLATLANVSQGAVSRFETGRGRYTPAAVLLNLAVALARHCRANGHTVLSEPLVRMLNDLEDFVPSVGTALPRITRDLEAEELQRLFNVAPAHARSVALAVLRSMCDDSLARPAPPRV